ncbi:tRNA wybutosine-synthesizing protein 4-like [Paramacrobiotus metropolitanus]|uniref:tRNA wybutosine-synthesizing protein 4-like n=1 Tax=Paramacrobiotus metropolitanus TaxID=2943436 RepID=UPI002445A589|nr:tRNA wybutosine-synthesizing protein 4-like [Paramacrobiotus metropolitanus]
MNALRHDESVQKTNDFSSVSKCSMTAAGYMKDEFMQHFVAKKVRRTPLINRGYFVRMHAVHSVIDTFLEAISGGAFTNRDASVNSGTGYAHNCSIIVLGAGYDTLYFRLEKTSVKIIDIDFLEVASNKAKMILNTPEMREKLSSVTLDMPEKHEGFSLTLSSDNYVIVGMDLRNCSQFVNLIDHLKLNCDAPTMIISEVVLTYIPESHNLLQCQKILMTLASFFSTAVFFNYEQVQPEDSFGKFMLQHFRNQGSPLQNTELYPTAASHENRLINCNWQRSLALSVMQYWRDHISSQEKSKVSNLEPFDEFEEFYEKCRHYVISLAANGGGACVLDKYSQSPHKTHNPENQGIKYLPCLAAPSAFMAYSHSSGVVKLLTADGSQQIVIVLVGGISPQSTAPGAAAEMDALQITDGIWAVWIPSRMLDSDFIRPLVHHGIYRCAENELHVIGGRTSPGKSNYRIYRLRFDCIRSTKLELRVAVFIDTIDSNVTDAPITFMQRTSAAVLHQEGVDNGIVILCSSSLPRQGTSLCAAHSRLAATFTPLRSCAGQCPLQYPSLSGGCNRILFSGGMKENKAVSDILELRLDKSTGIMNVGIHECGHLGRARFGHTSHTWENFLIVIGGVSDDADAALPDLTVYDIENRCEWNFQLQLTPDCLLMLFHHSSVLLEDFRTIVITGGGGNCFSFGTHFNSCFCVIDLDDLLKLCRNK